jgi:hypothetical protein
MVVGTSVGVLEGCVDMSSEASYGARMRLEGGCKPPESLSEGAKDAMGGVFEGAAEGAPTRLPDGGVEDACSELPDG